MNVGKTLYAKNRREWRAWLAKHHRAAPEIWLIYYKKESGKPRIPYNHAVEEALCYGWIDSILKPVDARRYAQRFSPRRSTSRLSEMNRERVRRTPFTTAPSRPRVAVYMWTIRSASRRRIDRSTIASVLW